VAKEVTTEVEEEATEEWWPVVIITKSKKCPLRILRHKPYISDPDYFVCQETGEPCIRENCKHDGIDI